MLSPAQVAVMISPCFAHDGAAGQVHLVMADMALTLCGLRAFPRMQGAEARRRITCQACRERKPRVLGGS